MNNKNSFGTSYPLGSTLHPGGANFSVYANNATAMELLLFESVDSDQPKQIIAFDPIKNCTFHYWHIFVPNIQAGQLYAYRVYVLNGVQNFPGSWGKER